MSISLLRNADRSSSPRPARRSATSRFSSTVIRLNARTTWNVRPIPARSDAIRRPSGDPPPVEGHLAGICRDHSGDDVEHRGLARPVRADQPVDPPRDELDVEIVDCDHASESLGQPAAPRQSLDHTHGHLRPAWPGKPMNVAPLAISAGSPAESGSPAATEPPSSRTLAAGGRRLELAGRGGWG